MEVGQSDDSSREAIIRVIRMRKEQLFRQQQSVSRAIDDAEKVNLLSLSRQKVGGNSDASV